MESYFMKVEQTTSWIFLAIAIGTQDKPISFNSISAIADGINHAIPSHKELQTSISWLTRNKLINKSKNLYSLTGLGQLAYRNASIDVNTVLIIWKNLEHNFKNYVGWIYRSWILIAFFHLNNPSAHFRPPAPVYPWCSRFGLLRSGNRWFSGGSVWMVLAQKNCLTFHPFATAFTKVIICFFRFPWQFPAFLQDIVL